MGYGSTIAVENEEDRCMDGKIRLIAETAAVLIVEKGLSREAAIEKATDWWDKSDKADHDVTGTLEIELQSITPSQSSNPKQIAAIANELMEIVRDEF